MKSRSIRKCFFKIKKDIIFKYLFILQLFIFFLNPAPPYCIIKYTPFSKCKCNNYSFRTLVQIVEKQKNKQPSSFVIFFCKTWKLKIVNIN